MVRLSRSADGGSELSACLDLVIGGMPQAQVNARGCLHFLTFQVTPLSVTSGQPLCSQSLHCSGAIQALLPEAGAPSCGWKRFGETFVSFFLLKNYIIKHFLNFSLFPSSLE